ncbi:MAG TPA: endo alpha-1,4 polygalactosaminidase [bacterium]|nr:endo alpha-1,4 polygalactosaminidase [bacterium]
MVHVFLVFAGICVPVSFAVTPAQVDDWTYQLQGYAGGLTELTQSKFDLAVIDYSRTGDAPGEWTAAEIAALKSNGPCGDRIVLAYISIGEAEDYRYYWNSDWVDGSGNPIPGVAPDWLGPQNPDWPGNYKVRYWMPGWQAILFGTASGPDRSYLDRIIDQGFDGIYMDIIDAFEFWGPAEIGGNNENRNAGDHMIDLVSALGTYARNTRQRPGFYLFPQNGSYIIDPDVYPDATDPEAEAAAQASRYFSMITGIGAEDTFFPGDAEENNPYDPDTWTIQLLNRFRDAGKPVLSVEYITLPGYISAFYTDFAPAQGYVPYATVRDLGTMTVNPGFEPDCEASPGTPITIALDMGGKSFGTGDVCRLDLIMTQSGAAKAVDLYVLLEVYGMYFSYPSWTEITHGLGGCEITVPTGTSSRAIIPSFAMPPVSPAGPLYFYGLMFDPGTLDVDHMASNCAVAEFYLD